MIVAPRPRFRWALRSHSIELGERTLVVGIVNVTPDSFSEHGECSSPEAAIKRCHQFLNQGADILDVGGESTRPGDRPPVSAQEEQDRVLPVIEAVRKAHPRALISVDTYKAATARAAVGAGAEIVNDVSGFLWDPEMAATCAVLKCGAILMHTRGRMREWRTQPRLAAGEVLPLVLRELGERLAAATAVGVESDRIALDPGFGFGKVGDENYPLLACFDRLHALGRPLMAGTSRKSFLGKTITKLEGREVPPGERGIATLASVTATVLAGAHLIRVHDVKAAREAAAIADAIRASSGIC